MTKIMFAKAAAALAVLIVLPAVASNAQQAPNAPTVVAGIPVNYDESQVGKYELPELLRTSAGKPVVDQRSWLRTRRPEIVRMIEEMQFGRVPSAAGKLKYEVVDAGTPVFGGKAIRKFVKIALADAPNAPKIGLAIYLPAGVKRAPVLLSISFSAPNQAIDDPGLPVGEIWNRERKKVPAAAGGAFGKVDPLPFIAEGIGFATFYYGDIEPDFPEGYKFGIRGVLTPEAVAGKEPSAWGAIAAWSWGLSRVMDYFERDKQVDAKRIAIQGASRLGKTVLWAGARDERFKVVIASVSGEGGAAVARRNFGETIAHITDPSRYLYQFAPRYHDFSNKAGDLPFDAHMLVALVAPRPLLLQTGSTDFWSDPRGEFESAKAAGPVWRLFGKTAPPVDAAFPAANDEAFLMNDLAYEMHEGGHGVLPQDWKRFVRFLKAKL